MVPQWLFEERYQDVKSSNPSFESSSSGLKGKVGRVDVGDYVKIKLGRKEFGIIKFSEPLRVKEVHKWHVVLENGQNWNFRRIALYSKGRSGVAAASGESSSSKNVSSSKVVINSKNIPDELVQVDKSVQEGVHSTRQRCAPKNLCKDTILQKPQHHQMEEENHTWTNGFLILGFRGLRQLQIPLFVCFLLIYIATLVGNLLIIVIVRSNAHLDTPMYFFLTNLSCLDIIYTTIIFPKMLANIFLDGMHISYSECLLQLYGFLDLASTELILLAVMAFDRYMAICNPLHYSTIINRNLCMLLAAGTWLFGLLNSIPHTVLVSRLNYCGSHTINHFFCDLSALLKLSCTNTQNVEMLTYILGAVVALVPFLFIAASYLNIICSILKIQSTQGRQKTFSTCASHFTVVIVYYGSLCLTYMRPTSKYSKYDDKLMSLMYIAIAPLCNPIIYSLKNTEFKKALRKRKA
ncbi:olfactory receptor 5V1-like [Lissotriton helveticus]